MDHNSLPWGIVGWLWLITPSGNHSNQSEQLLLYMAYTIDSDTIIYIHAAVLMIQLEVSDFC